MAGKKGLHRITTKQQRFVSEYIKTGSAAEAYLLAGYKSAKREHASQNASMLLNNPRIASLVEREQKKLQMRLDVSAYRVLNELACVAFSDFRRMFRPDGTLMDIQEMDDDTAASISSIEVEEETTPDQQKKVRVRTKKVKLWDKISALEKLGKHLNLFNEKQDSGTQINILVNSESTDDELAKRIQLLAERVRARQFVAGGSAGVQEAGGQPPASAVVEALPRSADDGIREPGS